MSFTTDSLSKARWIILIYRNSMWAYCMQFTDARQVERLPVEITLCSWTLMYKFYFMHVPKGNFESYRYFLLHENNQPRNSHHLVNFYYKFEIELRMFSNVNMYVSCHKKKANYIFQNGHIFNIWNSMHKIWGQVRQKKSVIILAEHVMDRHITNCGAWVFSHVQLWNPMNCM